MKPSIALIGPGKVGCAVSRRLFQAGYPFRAVISRAQSRAEEACRFIGCAESLASQELSSFAGADILLLAVPDDQIQSLAQKLQQQQKLSARQALLHFSGLHGAELMRTAGSEAQLLSLHPLLPFASRELAVQNLAGCPCAIEGDRTALPLATQLVNAIDGRPFAIASDKKALYHASACIASNYLVTLLDTARELLQECGIPEGKALSLLLPLLQATLDNTVKLGPEAGLTGPLVRGDSGTVEKHLRSLQEAAPNSLPLYRLLGEKTVQLAKRSGRLELVKAEQFSRLLRDE